MSGFISTALALLTLYGARRLIVFWNAIRAIDNLPGYRVLFSQHSVPALMVRARGVTTGNNHFFEDKHSAFKEWDMNSVVSVFSAPLIALTIADADVVKELTFSRARFPKPVYEYEVVSKFFGRNIVASEGEEWKKYRKISAPAFSDRNNKLVWNETVQITSSLFDEIWKDRNVISHDHCLDITLPIALFVIGVAGFGKRISWHDDVDIPAGHKLSFKESLHTASSDIMLALITPDWILKHGTTRMRDVKAAFDELGLYMSEMIRHRQTSEKVERHDLLSSLLEANNTDNEEARLTEGELMGNIFIFLLAGHETTAHTLCFTFALLAFHEEEQEKLFQHIKTTLPDGRIPTYEDMPRLTHSMAAFYETLRLFPSIVNIPKISAEDTTLTVGNIHGKKRIVPVPKGALLYVNTPGLHYNPRYWDDPETFNPSRFLKADWNRDAFMPFSAGARACLGRRFFETEGIAILTMMVSRYKISIKEEPQFAGETIDQRKARIFRTKNGLTQTPIRVPLTFTRRSDYLQR